MNPILLDKCLSNLGLTEASAKDKKVIRDVLDRILKRIRELERPVQLELPYMTGLDKEEDKDTTEDNE